MKQGNTTSPEFTWPVRVYWEDTDAGGVVYHAGYVRFMERARTEWLRSFGVDQPKLRADSGVGFMVRDMQLDFLAPARLDDALTVSVAVTQCRRVSLVMEQIVTRGDKQLVQGVVRVVCVDLERMRPAPIPDFLYARIS